MNIRSRNNIQGVVFDIDGVIADTRRSYLETIRITTETYLTEILGVSPIGSPLLSIKDVEQFKMLGGFNNDWDSVEGLLYYFLRLAKRCGLALGGASLADLRRLKNIPALLAGRQKNFLNQKQKIVSYAKIVRIFQEVYLGDRIFRLLYRKKTCYWKRPGLHLKETPLLTKSFFLKIKNRGWKLGVATGRIRYEAEMVLRRFGLLPCFDTIVTADETPRSQTKPHPFVLLENARQLKIKRLAYVGDLPDDMTAAWNARKRGLEVLGIGTLAGINEKNLMRRGLLKARASWVVNNQKELERVFDTLN